MNATVTPSQIIATICNRRQNSDVRADDLEVRFALDKAFAEERDLSVGLLTKLREADHLINRLASVIINNKIMEHVPAKLRDECNEWLRDGATTVIIRAEGPR